MEQVIYFDKAQEIKQLLIYVIILPLILGFVVGSITGKFKPGSIKLPLFITGIISLTFFGVILMTLQNQSLPALAIVLTVVIIIIVNGSAVISYKIASNMTHNK